MSGDIDSFGILLMSTNIVLLMPTNIVCIQEHSLKDEEDNFIRNYKLNKCKRLMTDEQYVFTLRKGYIRNRHIRKNKLKELLR